MATNTKNKIERAYTPKDIESNDFECILTHQMNQDIFSIDDGDISDKITVPVGAQQSQYWARGNELERAFSSNSAALSSEFVKVVTEAKEGTQEALTAPLQKYINDVCNSTYQNLPDEVIPEWVVVAKNQINENLATKIDSWWADIIICSSSSKKHTLRNGQDSVSIEIRALIRTMINELNGIMHRILTSCEQKERDKASKLILTTLEATAKKTSENTEACKRLSSQVGKLASFVYRTQHERCQKQLKLWDMDQYIEKGITDYRALASSIYTSVKSMFTENHLHLPKSTSIEVRGQNKKKEYFILALFSSISEAKTFEHQAAEGRRKNVTKMKTQRMEPQDAEAFPLISWKDAATALKRFAEERVGELKVQHEGDDSSIAKIEACNARISEMKVWRLYQPKVQKHFFEFLCPFRPGKRYHTSSLTSPFTRILITDLK